MEFNWIWQAVLIVIVGTLLLRIAGRKSISQMTLAQTVIMIGLGSLLIQPVAGKGLWITFGVGGIFIITLIIIEYGQIKSNVIERFISGHSVVLIENGSIIEKNLKKLRLTVDQLEMQLRQVNISKISDVQWATLEPNGRLGYTLIKNAQYATKKDIQEVIDLIHSKLPKSNPETQTHLLDMINEEENKSNHPQNIFTEVKDKSHVITPPKHLQ